MRYYDKMWKSYEELYSCVEEDYGGIETVKSYNMEETMKKKHAKINDGLTYVNKRAVVLSSAVQPSSLSPITLLLSRCVCSAESSPFRVRSRWRRW